MATTTPTKPSSSLYQRVTPPEDLLEAMLRAARIYMEHERRTTIHKADVERALVSMGFSMAKYRSGGCTADPAFGAFVRKLTNDKLKVDLGFTDEALCLLEYQHENTFSSPTGVSVRFLEHDWTKHQETENHDEDQEWDETLEGETGNEKNGIDDDDDDESIIRRAMLVDKEDDEFQTKLDCIEVS